MVGEGSRPNLRHYLFPKQSDSGRSFQFKWVEKHDWLEYSKDRDAVYCYPCRQFGIGNKSDVFCTSGFNNWQKALASNQGFQRHEHSSIHISSMLSWKEHESRASRKQEVSSLLNETVLEKRRYYLKAIVSTILFLAKSELPFRGDWNEEENEENGHFRNLFKYTLERNEELQQCQKIMAANALYTSAQIQNEIIHVAAEILRESIAAEMNKSSFLTLMADGMRDRNGNEILSIVFRYTK